MRLKFTAGLWLAAIAFCAWGWQVSPQPAAADGSTPLHDAVYRDELKQVEALLRAGAKSRSATR